MSPGFNSVIQQLKAAAKGFQSLVSYLTHPVVFFANSISNPLTAHTEKPEEPQKKLIQRRVIVADTKPRIEPTTKLKILKRRQRNLDLRMREE